MNAPKIFILVLILIVVLFAIGAGVGLFREDKSDLNTQDTWQKRLKKLTSGQDVLVRPDEIQAGKPPFGSPTNKLFVVPQGARLEFLVGASEQQMRTLELERQDTSKVRVQWFRKGEDDALLDLPLKDKPVKLQVTKEGGKFVLTCEQGAEMPPVARLKMR
jgi:hypothetical protein